VRKVVQHCTNGYISFLWGFYIFSGSTLEVRPVNRFSHKMAYSTWIRASRIKIGIVKIGVHLRKISQN